MLCKSVLYTFQSGLCSLDADYNGMQALSSVTAPGELDGQVEEKEEEVEKEKEKEKEEIYVFALWSECVKNFHYVISTFIRTTVSFQQLPFSQP